MTPQARPQAPLPLQVALLTDRGGRAYNEDACGHWQSGATFCAVLADGAGGHGGGDLAARFAVQRLIEGFANQASPGLPEPAALAATLHQLNQALRGERQAGSASEHMHCTIVCLLLDLQAGRACWAHAGDSRLYHFRPGRRPEHTRDHSLVQDLVDAGLLAEMDLRRHPQRSELHSALGVAPEELQVASQGCVVGDAGPGEAFLLCSDGLWEYVDDDALQLALDQAATPSDWLEALAVQVRLAAADKPRHDNFSALAVWLGNDPPDTHRPGG